MQPPSSSGAGFAGRLAARWVIHTVGPVYSGEPGQEGTLRSCYTRSLAVADELGAHTVAFPLISAGAFGWLNRDGDLDLNILIRSAEVMLAESGGREVRFRTGAGIVADSVPERELDETRAKARGVLRALEG